MKHENHNKNRILLYIFSFAYALLVISTCNTVEAAEVTPETITEVQFVATAGR